jgi:inhibitor of cysteine peptidase
MRTLTRSHVAWGSLLLLATLALTACGSDAEPAEGGRTIELGAKDSGGTVTARPGDRIVITLESNVTTGYAWKLVTEPASEVLDLVDSEYVAPDTDLVGAGGEEVWTFVATGEGTTALAMSYQRSSGETAGDPFDLTVLVQPA